MMKPSCSNCRFGIEVINGRSLSGTTVVCRRYPPTPVLMIGESYEPGDTLQGYWPRVSPDDDCGEHQYRENEKCR